MSGYPFAVSHFEMDLSDTLSFLKSLYARHRLIQHASQIALPDDDFIELAERGYDTEQIARALRSDINFVAIKGDLLRSQGYQFNHQEHRNDFLKYNK